MHDNTSLCAGTYNELSTEPRIAKENGPVDLSTNQVRPLGIKGLRDVFSNISSYYMNCKDDVKFIIAAMSIKIKQLVFEGVKNLREISIEAQTAIQECVMSITKDIILPTVRRGRLFRIMDESMISPRRMSSRLSFVP